MHGILFYLIGRILFSSRSASGKVLEGRHLAAAGIYLAYLTAGCVVAFLLSLLLVPSDGVTTVLVFTMMAAAVAGGAMLPEWLAWRICGPRGRRRTGRAFLALAAVGRRRIDREGERLLFSAAYEPAITDLRMEAAGPWTAVALVVEAERQGDAERAARLADGLMELPLGSLLSRRWRRIGVEHLALDAARRGDWPEVARRVQPGRGRGVWLLRLLARAHAGERVSPRLLRLAWALSPRRRESRGWLPAAVSSAENAPVLDAADRNGGPWTVHLRLLAAAASGRPVSAGDLAGLGRSWNEALDPRQEAAWITRGSELGARAPDEAFAGLRSGVLEEMDALLDSAQGAWPQEPPPPLMTDLLERRRDRLLTGLEHWTADFRNGTDRPMQPPLDEWTEWVIFRRHVLRLVSCGGTEALETAWHNGLRLTACNWPVHLHAAHGPRAAWPAYVMHVWSSWLAAWAGDVKVQELSQSNARILYQKAAE